jgi:hypothetical protein
MQSPMRKHRALLFFDGLILSLLPCSLFFIIPVFTAELSREIFV